MLGLDQISAVLIDAGFVVDGVGSNDRASASRWVKSIADSGDDTLSGVAVIAASNVGVATSLSQLGLLGVPAVLVDVTGTARANCPVVKLPSTIGDLLDAAGVTGGAEAMRALGVFAADGTVIVAGAGAAAPRPVEPEFRPVDPRPAVPLPPDPPPAVHQPADPRPADPRPVSQFPADAAGPAELVEPGSGPRFRDTTTLPDRAADDTTPTSPHGLAVRGEVAPAMPGRLLPPPTTAVPASPVVPQGGVFASGGGHRLEDVRETEPPAPAPPPPPRPATPEPTVQAPPVPARPDNGYSPVGFDDDGFGGVTVPDVPRGAMVGLCVFVAAKGGGVGKTTATVHLAERAAESGLRVLVVDADRSQGDVRRRLGLSGPTITEAATQWRGTPEDLARFVVSPDSRRSTGKTLSADYLLGPISGAGADKRLVSDELYSAILDAACQCYDIVFVDTHPVAVDDPHDQFRLTFLPRLLSRRTRDRLVVISDWDRAKAWNALEWVTMLADGDGVSPSRIATLFNEHEENNDFGLSADSIRSKFARFDALGMLPRSDAVRHANNEQRLGFSDLKFAAAVDRALLELTGDDRFVPEVPTTKRFGWLPRRKG